MSSTEHSGHPLHGVNCTSLISNQELARQQIAWLDYYD